MTVHESLMEFPCNFPIKVIGINSPTLKTDVETIARKHFPETSGESITSQTSEKSNYIAITVTVHSLAQASLDALYQELTQHPDIKMVL